MTTTRFLPITSNTLAEALYICGEHGYIECPECSSLKQPYQLSRKRYDAYLRNKYLKHQLRKAVWKRDGHRCVWCKRIGSKHKLPLVLDHRIPLIKVGTNEVSNLVTSCFPCNGLKGGKMPTDPEWLRMVIELRLKYKTR